MNVLALAASRREGSLNRRLIENAVRIAEEAGWPVELVHFRDFDMPIYDGDLEAAEGLPPGAQALVERVRWADAILLSTPEYNFSIAGPLKNAIDWVSRARPMPWRGRSLYLLSASPSPMGGIRGLWQTRVPLEGCGALVFPDMFALPHAREAFGEDGRLLEARSEERLRKELVGFLDLAETILPACSANVPLHRRDRQRSRAIAAALEEQTEIQPPG